MNTEKLTSKQEQPKLLPDQMNRYHEDGYVEVENVFSKDELSNINREISRLKQGQRDKEKKGIHAGFIFQLGLRSEVTRDLCQDERILSLIEDLVKPGIAIYSAKMVEKQPFNQTVCHWHQDDAYYQKNSESSCRMSVWIPLQDCDESNGCVWMVPGSHRRGLEAYTSRKDGSCSLSFADGHQEIEGAVPCAIKAGSVLLFHALTWHRSLGNQTRQPRRSFIISYQDALAKRGSGDQHKILRAA